ncbi:XRE family transcriptional regulator [Pelistega sp. MC2]|uniref:LexA family transcriptional regulator n=1 Tax=Pelistega sp. MC2 TaxID=1720297 RepID=UPI0008D9FC44|nr:XRE family transcriptional regulator [Pelistega sp. MC2]
MKQINDIRLNNLRALINEAGTQEKLATAAGISPIYLNQIIKQRIDNATGKSRNIGNSTARKLESAMNKPFGWLDQDHSYDESVKDGYIELEYYDIRSSAGPGSVVDYVPAISKMLVLEDWAREYLKTIEPKNIRIINNKGVSMYPTINDGDLLFVDISCNRYDGDGIYVILDDEELKTKRLIKEDGIIRIISDNPSPAYKEKTVSAKNQHTLMICGKVRRYFALKDAT